MSSGPALLPSILNLRDVADTINHASHTERLRTGRLWRSARPDNASAADRRRLKEELGIKTIIDLRTKTEHVENARKHEKRRKATASNASDVEGTPVYEPLRIPDITYRDINFNGKAYSDSLIEQLSWPQYLKLIALMVSGYRTQGISILGENVMKQRGLTGLATDSIKVCTAEVKQVFDVLADEANYPVLIHCTQGIHDINTDYMLSESELEPEKAERLKEIRSIGLTDEFAACAPGLVPTVHTYILDFYCSVREYLSEGCGVTEDMQGRVRRILLQQLDASSDSTGEKGKRRIAT